MQRNNGEQAPFVLQKYEQKDAHSPEKFVLTA